MSHLYKNIYKILRTCFGSTIYKILKKMIKIFFLLFLRMNKLLVNLSEIFTFRTHTIFLIKFSIYLNNSYDHLYYNL